MTGLTENEISEEGVSNENRKRNLLWRMHAAGMVFAGCSAKEDARNTIYEDMQADFEKADLLSACTGINAKTESGILSPAENAAAA